MENKTDDREGEEDIGPEKENRVQPEGIKETIYSTD